MKEKNYDWTIFQKETGKTENFFDGEADLSVPGLL